LAIALVIGSEPAGRPAAGFLLRWQPKPGVQTWPVIATTAQEPDIAVRPILKNPLGWPDSEAAALLHRDCIRGTT
jgi:hypothetical protein